MSTYVVTCSHTQSYADPLVVSKGDTVALDERDGEWPGWVWCWDAAGKGGWLPEEIVEQNGESGRVRELFDTTELTVQIGEFVSGGRIVAGWQWCRRQDGRDGWVPIACLQEQPRVS